MRLQVERRGPGSMGLVSSRQRGSQGRPEGAQVSNPSLVVPLVVSCLALRHQL